MYVTPCHVVGGEAPMTRGLHGIAAGPIYARRFTVLGSAAPCLVLVLPLSVRKAFDVPVCDGQSFARSVWP